MIIKVSKPDVGRSIQSLSLLDVGENGAKLQRISVILESFRALEVKPKDLA